MITITLESIAYWEEEQIASLIRLLDAQDIFKPDKWGPYAPLRTRFSLASLSEMQKWWNKSRGLQFRRTRPSIGLMMDAWLQFKRANHMGIFLEDEFFESQSARHTLDEFVSELVGWGNMVYGYGCHGVDFESKNKLPRPTLIGGKLIATGGVDIRECLPGVYWANYFGPEYVNWFGSERFDTLPCYEQRELLGGGRLVFSSASPLDYDQPGVRELEDRIRRHLGETAFFEVQYPARETISPFLDGTLTIG